MITEPPLALLNHRTSINHSLSEGGISHIFVYNMVVCLTFTCFPFFLSFLPFNQQLVIIVLIQYQYFPQLFHLLQLLDPNCIPVCIPFSIVIVIVIVIAIAINLDSILFLLFMHAFIELTLLLSPFIYLFESLQRIVIVQRFRSRTIRD